MAKLTMKEREYLRIADEMLAKDRKAQAGGGASSLTPAARTALETHVQVYPRQGSVEARQLAGNSLAYAQQSPKNAQEVALGLTAGNATRPSKGNVSALDMDQLRQGTLDNETTMKILRDLGALNTTDNVRNRETISTVGTDYLKEQATISKALMAASSAMDSIHMTGKRMAYPGTAAKKEKAAQWRDFYDLYGYEKEVPLEVMLRAEAIANGTGRTVRDFDLMDDETYDREYAALEEWYKGLDPFALTENPEEIAYESKTGKWAEMADMQSAELARRETIERLTAMAMGNADYDTLSVYTDTYEEPAGIKRVFGNDAFIQGYDDQLRFMNTRPSYAEIELASEYSGVVRGYANAGYDYLTDDELAVYNVLYHTDQAAAAEYLEALSPDLLRRRAQVQYNYNTVIGENPIAGTIASAGTILEAPGTTMATLLGAVMGEDDPNSYYYDPIRKQTAIRTAQAQLWGDMLSFDVLGQPVGATIFNTLMSLGDMGMAYLTGGALAGGNAAFAQQAMGFIMASEAAAGTIHEDLQRGFTAEQALLHGITNGAVEYLSEQIPLGELFSNEGKLAWRILKTGLSEGGEEIFSGTVQIGTDALFSYMSGRESEVETVYKEYAKTMSHEDAVRATLSHYAEEVALQGVTGFLSGGAMGTVAHTANDMQTRSYGKSIMAEGDVDAILNIAGSMRNDSQSAEWARRLTEKKNKGKKISTYDVGRLTMAMESDLSAELAEAPNMVMDKAIEERLAELGEDSANAAKLAPVIRKLYRGQKINPAARMSVNWSDNASQVVRELTTEVREGDEGRVGRDWKVRAVQLAEETSAPYVDKGVLFEKALRTKPGTTAETTAAPAVSSDADVQQGEEMAAAGKNKFGPKPLARAVIFDADGTEQTGEVVRFEKDKDGMHAVVATTADGKTANVNVDLESITASASAGIGSIVRYIQNSATRGHDMSAAEASTMIRLYEQEGGDAKTFIDGFEKAYLAGYAGIELDSAGISEGVAKIAYDQGKAEAVADEKGRVARATRVRADSKGVVSWLGKVFSGKEVRGTGDANALSAAMRKMTSSQRTTVQVVQAFADKFKTNVVLFESSDENIGSIENGSYDPNTNTIYIDINSGADSAESIKAGRKHNTLGHAMVRTLGHELTHHLESTSPEAYATYKQAVKTALKEQGQDWATLVRGKLDTARNTGRKLTYAGAEAEVIADASEYMLQNSKFVKEIDNSTKGRVKKFIKDFMKKLGEVFSTLTRAHTESAAIRKEVDGVKQYMGNLQQLWDAAMEESIGREVGVDNQQSEENTPAVVQKSLRDQRYLEAVKNGNMDTAQYLVDAAAQSADYEPLKLFHGTNAFGFTKIDVTHSDDHISFFATNKPEVAAGYVKYYDSNEDNWAKPTEIGKKTDRPQALPADASIEDYLSVLGKYAGNNEMFDYKNGHVATEEDRHNALKAPIFQIQNEINGLKTWYMPYTMEYYVTDIEYAISRKDYSELLGLTKRRNEYNSIPYDTLGFHVYNSLSNISYAMYQVEQILSAEAAFIPRANGQGSDTFFTKDRLRMEYNDLTSGANSGIYQVYARNDNQLVISTNGSNWNRIRVPEDMQTGVLEGRSTASTREFSEWAWKNGYNSIKFEDLYDNGAYGGNDMADIYAFFTNNGPEMIKSADPVTYDDDGNVIPLSERFNVANEDIRYSIRDGFITTESTEQERYNILKDVALKLAHVNTGRLEDVDLDAYNTRKKSSVEKGIRALANKLGITNVDLENSYIDFPFQFTNKNLGKSLHHQLDYGGTYQDYVKAMSCFDELVENAVPIETHPDKKLGTVKGNTDLKQVYVLVSAFKDSNRVVPVQFEIKEYRGNNGKLYMMVALTKITPEVVEAPGVRNAKVPAPLFSGDTISLRYLFENVNSSDYKFFKYIPDGFLSDEQKAAKARALSDQAEEYASYGNDVDDSSPDGIEVDDDTESAYPIQNSVRTWGESDYVTHRNEAAERLAKAIGVSVSKAKKWIDDVNSVSAYILGNKARLDYIPTAVKGMSAFKSNPEYGGSIDMSTICAKRRLATGTLDAIQRVLGDAVLTKDDFLHIREMMKERGYEVACGLCFVESSRKNLSKYNRQFLDQYKAEHPDSDLGMVDLNTVEGLERIRSNPETADVYAAYEKFMNKLAQRKPKLFEKRTEYNHEILKKFKSDTTVGIKNRNGGLRLQSFSDFEIVHLIDMMQVITDMASVGLAGQAYTKVPDFAWALGDTGLKINLSLIAKDVDADGNLVFDDVEGMNHEEAKRLRDSYSKNVGTIVVTFTDEQTIAAMKSDFIDYIIPFHRSQWQKGDYKKLGLPEGTKDYTLHQNEKEGRKRVKENFLPNAYWDFSVSGKQNAINYLNMCAEAGRTPKFSKFLDKQADGSYRLKEDGSTDGYWKLLIDFKMYDNAGVGSPQLAVQPDFNMDQAMRMLEEYKGEHDTFPVAQDVVDDFVKEYRGDVGGVKVSDGRYTVSPIQQSARDLPPEVTAREFLTEADISIAETVEERNALSIYQGLLLKHADASDKVIAAEKVLAAADEADLPEARKALTAARARQKELYNRLLNVERTAHVQTIVKRTNRIIGDLSGKDKADVDNMVSTLQARLESLRLDLQGLKGAAKTQREADIRAVEREMANLKNKAVNALLATNEKYTKRIADLRERNELNVEIGKKARHIKRVVKRLNDRIIHEEDYKNVKEPLKPAVHNLVRAFIDGFGNLVFDQKTADHLRTVYDKIADEKEGSPDFYSNDVADWLTDLAVLAEQDEARRIAGGSSLESVEQKLETYNRVAEIADHIYKMVAEADEIFVNGKRESFAAISGEVGGGLVSKKDKPLLVGKAREAVRIFDDLIRTGNMTPQYFFDHLKNSGLSKLFSGLMIGQTQYAQRIREGQEVIADAKRRYNFYAWKNMKQGVEFRTEQGHTIFLTVPQMMWVYATAKREATNTLMDTHHLDEGGFRYEANDLPRQKGKLTAIPGIDRLHKLSANDVAKITATLTAEQIACADELVSYLSNKCAEQGNATSMELFGIKKYNEEYYFPFETASDQRHQRSDAGSTSTTNDARARHASFTHSLRRGANTALVMGDFFDVIADHINLMATYSSFVVPIESMNRVLNTKINEEEDGSGNDVTIRSLVGRKHGDPAQKYIADLMKDLNGGPQTDNRGGISGLFRAFKRGAVMGSLSVALQQPTAIVRAFAYVNPKYFAHITMEGNKKTWERMMKYSGTTVIKDMGKFDVGTGRMANDWIANSDMQDYKLWQRAKFLMDTKGWKAVKDNFIETMTALPGVMDRITWSHIWKAIEAEQADLNPSMDRNSDEFLRTVGARFDDVINHTQVYDSILAKSQNMRSKNPLTQMSTAFMSEPTLNINMLYDAIRGDHSKGQRASIITSVITSNILAAAAAALIAAWNKDDDDRNAVEKYLTTFASRALDNLNPLTMIPYVADLWNLVNGYDIERTDLSVLKDAWDYGSTFMSKAFDPEKENTWRDYENFFGTIANLFGIPAKNVSRDIRRARNFLATDKDPASGSGLKYALVEELTPFGLYKASNAAYCQRLVAAVMDGDTQEAYDLWDYMTNGKKMSQGSLETNIRSELKRLVRAGEMTPAQATDILRKYVPYKDDKNNVKYPQDWLNEKE